MAKNSRLRLEREREWIIRDKYSGKTNPGLANDLRRLEAGEPLAYVIGWVSFLGLRIDLGHRPLIPRPETEYWTEQVVKRIAKRKVRVLDMFCGSGCIGLAILKHCPNAQVIFSDIDLKALKQVRHNARLNGIPTDRYHLVNANIWNGFGAKFDVVLANPPYIPSGRKKSLDLSVRAYEPARALFSGKKGDGSIRKFLSGLAAHLTEGGLGVLEFDSLAQIRPFLKKKGIKITPKKDQFDRYRYAEVYLTK